jgi:hypothetical protein
MNDDRHFSAAAPRVPVNERSVGRAVIPLPTDWNLY